jgi:hypothetical protein
VDSDDEEMVKRQQKLDRLHETLGQTDTNDNSPESQVAIRP